MSAVIYVLPDHVANQIAAGEVVERPASVVKELVENALDAGATRVRVEVADGGKRLIRVLDNGSGMSADDAVTALLRHATSKVRSAEDLRRIGTLGFRGEALPSIRSVSQFSIRTRRAEDDCGVKVVANGAEEPIVEPSGGPVGTEVTVADLFFNVPARRKFLRRTGTEMSRISAFIDQIALGWPEVHFTLIHNDRRSADYPADRDLQARILSVLGRDTCRKLHRISLEIGEHSVMGFTSEPTHHKPNSRGMFTYVNGRFVRDKVLQHAVTQAYGSLLDRGRYPSCVLYVNVPPEAVDINVHPAKSEVRFVESGAIHGLIERALRLTLADAPWGELGGGVPTRGLLGGDGSGFGELPLALAHPGASESQSSNLSSSSGSADYHPTDYLPTDQLPTDQLPDDHLPGDRLPSDDVPAPGPAAASMSGSAPDEPTEPGFFSRLVYVGQVARCYLVCQSPRAMHVIDQHAAHERVVYERLRARYSAGRVDAQRLLFPMQVTLDPTLARAATEFTETINRMGFVLEPFGGSDWLVSEVPVLLADRDPCTILKDVLSELGDVGHSRQVEAHIEHLLATMACHASVRSGDELGPEEVRDLLRQMDGVPLRANCPHGRPVIVSHGLDAIARWFNRT
jgi:DNA mismatch repair protein MutL